MASQVAHIPGIFSKEDTLGVTPKHPLWPLHLPCALNSPSPGRLPAGRRINKAPHIPCSLRTPPADARTAPRLFSDWRATSGLSPSQLSLYSKERESLETLIWGPLSTILPPDPQTGRRASLAKDQAAWTKLLGRWGGRETKTEREAASGYLMLKWGKGSEIHLL